MALGEHLYNYICNDLANCSGNYLEIGVFNGDGFARVAAKHKDKKCYALDPFIEDGYTTDHTNTIRGSKIDSQRKNFYNSIEDLTNVEHFELTSVQFSNNLTNQQVTDMDISYVLIDGSHHYDDVVNDYKLAVKLIEKNKSGTIQCMANDSALAFCCKWGARSKR